MEAFDRKGDDLNPDIQFNPTTSTLSIKGKSIPLNVDQFFNEVITWLEGYAKNPSDHTKIEIDLQYLNGKSLRSLLALLYTLKSMNDSGKNVSVQWYVPKDADDLLDLSEDLLTDLQIPHNIQMN